MLHAPVIAGAREVEIKKCFDSFKLIGGTAAK
jgi:hypothetical protein